MTLQRQGQDPGRIAEYYRPAALLEDQLASPQRAATICFNLGQLQQQGEDYAVAEQSYAKAAQLSGPSGVTAALALFQLGVVAELTGRRQLALERCEEALRFCQAAGLRRPAATAQCQIGILRCRDGDLRTGTTDLLRGYSVLAASAPDDGSAGQLAMTLDYLRLARKSLGASASRSWPPSTWMRPQPARWAPACGKMGGLRS